MITAGLERPDLKKMNVSFNNFFVEITLKLTWRKLESNTKFEQYWKPY